MRISTRAAAVPESTTLAITALAASLRAAGRDVVSLAAGEPDFDTPAAVAEAGIDAVRAGETHYTAASGTPALRAAIVHAMHRDQGLEYSDLQICVTAGSKPGIWLCLAALVDPGDVVIVPAPCWVSYPPLVALAGGKPLLLEAEEENAFVPTTAQLESAITAPGVRGILVNSPSNPTGRVWPPERMEALVALCAKHDRWILSDEIYAQIVYGDTRVVSPASFPAGKDRTAVLNGLSKAFAMTGWRIGWVAGPDSLLAPVKRMQSQMIGNACSISQAAAVRALADDRRGDVARMVASFGERRDWFVPALAKLRGFTLAPPEGAFYAFPGVAALCRERSCNDVELARIILEEALVATVPGSAFGKSGYIRLSFAAALEDLQRAVGRLSDWLEGATLRPGEPA